MTQEDPTDFASIAHRLGYVDAEIASTIRQKSNGDITLQKSTAIEHSFIEVSNADIVESILFPKRLIPGYEILELLGQGGMGVVYKAKQSNLDRAVALKTILIERVDPKNITRFEREARTIAKIQHPNIISIFDFGKSEGRFYYAMEYVDGLDVRELIERHGKLSEQKTWGIVRQVISGLAEASRLGIVHRDIKPANILTLQSPPGMNLPGNAPLAKVADFGLAIGMKIESTGEDTDRVTGEHTILGSPRYMSPEQFEESDVDFRSDIYSCGVTAFEVMSGSRPFSKLSFPKLVAKKINGDLTQEVEESNLSSGTKNLLIKMVAADPDSRFQSYSELLQAIDQTNQHEPQFQPSQQDDSNTIEWTRDDSGYSKTQSDLSTTIDASIQSDQPPSQLKEIKSPSSSIMPTAIAITALMLVLMTVWFVFEQVKYSPGHRDLVFVASSPLFNGEDFTGWPITPLSGAWSIELDPYGASAISGSDGTHHRPLPNDEWKHYSIDLSIWCQSTSRAEIEFSKSAQSEIRGVLSIEHDGNVKLCFRDRNGNETYLSSFQTKLRKDDYSDVHIERQTSDWFVFVGDDFVGTLPVQNDEQREFCIRAENGKVLFHQFEIGKLAPAE